MSLYQVDRVFYDVLGAESELKSYLEDPQRYLADLDLDEHERNALAECDYAALWAMGAHPLILMRFVRQVLIARGHPPGEIMKKYQSAIEPLGRPDYGT
jgi:hypothetical protein